MIMISPTNTRK